MTILTLAGTSCFALSQAPPGGEDLFRTLRPDIEIVITKHSTGADLVVITAEAANYPPAELQSAARAVGDAVKVPVRGLRVFSDADPVNKQGFLKATFATNGLLNGDGGINLQALARAFAGKPGAAKVEGIEVGLPDVAVTANTLPVFESDSVRVQGRTSPSFQYRIKLKSQDPAKIVIPNRLEAAAPVKPPVASTSRFPDSTLWLLVIVAAAAVGALVYNLALHRPGRTPRR